MNKNIACIMAIVSTLIVYYGCKNNPENAWQIDLAIYGMILYLVLQDKKS